MADYTLLNPIEEESILKYLEDRQISITDLVQQSYARIKKID